MTRPGVFLGFLKLLKTGKILADDVEFEVYDRAFDNVAEIGVLEGVGYDGYTEARYGAVAHGETHAVYSHRAFFYGHIALESHFAGHIVFECEFENDYDMEE